MNFPHMHVLDCRTNLVGEVVVTFLDVLASLPVWTCTLTSFALYGLNFPVTHTFSLAETYLIFFSSPSQTSVDFPSLSICFECRLQCHLQTCQSIEICFWTYDISSKKELIAHPSWSHSSNLSPLSHLQHQCFTTDLNRLHTSPLLNCPSYDATVPLYLHWSSAITSDFIYLHSQRNYSICNTITLSWCKPYSCSQKLDTTDTFISP